jgi:hypothetical protein
LGDYGPSTAKSLSVDVFGGYSTLSNPTGLVRAFSMASKDSGGVQGTDAAATTAQEAAETDEANKGADQPTGRLLLPQNSIQDGMRWFV